METIKVIDLLNKIANGEEVPKKIKIDNEIYVYDKKEDEVWVNRLYHREHNENVTFNFQFIPSYNDEVEIIEDTPKEDKKIEKLNLDTDELRGKETPRAIDYLLESKINEIIDKVNGEDNDSRRNV